MRGRGAPAKLKWYDVLPSHGPTNMGAVQAELRRVLKIRSRVRQPSLLRTGEHANSREARLLWARIRSGLREIPLSGDPPSGPADTRAWPTADRLGAWQAYLDRRVKTTQASEQLQRIKAWEQRLQLDWAKRRTDTYKWVRDSFHPKAAFMVMEDGSIYKRYEESYMTFMQNRGGAGTAC